VGRSRKKRAAKSEPLYRQTDFERRVAVPNKDGDFRDPFRRDLARLLHSPAFRRLQGKTQLFPSDENDFFRNRLTHSIEVSQIATGIALNLNATQTELEHSPINEHLVHFAARAHDLGHPPFGHNGEKTLDAELQDSGGFEGNAQTLRILARLEKKETESFPFSDDVAQPLLQQRDLRLGLNLTYRAMASILKYDRQIPATEEERLRQKIKRRPVKGYYDAESDIVAEIKAKVAPGHRGPFKTVECSIMDLADDIAYSTYDLEDAFKSGFLSPIGMAAATADEKTSIANEINEKLVEEYGAEGTESAITVDEIDSVLETAVFADLYETQGHVNDLYKHSAEIYRQSCVLGENGYFRTDFTSKLVNLFITGISFRYIKEFPCLSVVKFDIPTFKMVEILKKYAFRSLIMSPRLKIAESRGRDIIAAIFKSLMDTEDGRRLLPDDWRAIYFGHDSIPWQRRTVCDFIASMTDRYCVEFYSRLVGIDAPSIHKPY
jgi:dGTPase